MNTNKIINKCIEIPGISLKKNPANIELCMQQDNGKGSMTFFSIFPGISIAYIFINSPTWPIPDLSEQDDSLNTPLLLNYCVTGRCELFLDNDSFVYLKDGEFSISKKSPQKTERIITADLKQHHPAYELAKLFSISETSLKNYFRGIYGQNISVYLREARMNEAEKMLEKTKMPISKISEQVGYMNQSKFASVFKLQYNMSPLEYRRKKVIEEI
ncbi:AraC family transcriptional regulator [Clostridium estertheticum]|uniref:helix-turn-helix domain-containing protein n=1 Tax=Clostridium estertheticum TaxID=238834 RepID=UPI001C7D95F7|nr:AraC family transcriptional regulator [Clostridium estertheticum]MBX4262727.1 AraC family transcriptional regulator [Clostridium estertheticum]WLC68607.1 AraC family transcriptional regulator [Clostridium estertheticum]